MLLIRQESIIVRVTDSMIDVNLLMPSFRIHSFESERLRQMVAEVLSIHALVELLCRQCHAD
jgi:hypothetical protein